MEFYNNLDEYRIYKEGRYIEWDTGEKSLADHTNKINKSALNYLSKALQENRFYKVEPLPEIPPDYQNLSKAPQFLINTLNKFQASLADYEAERISRETNNATIEAWLVDAQKAVEEKDGWACLHLLNTFDGVYKPCCGMKWIFEFRYLLT